LPPALRVLAHGAGHGQPAGIPDRPDRAQRTRPGCRRRPGSAVRASPRQPARRVARRQRPTPHLVSLTVYACDLAPYRELAPALGALGRRLAGRTTPQWPPSRSAASGLGPRSPGRTPGPSRPAVADAKPLRGTVLARRAVLRPSVTRGEDAGAGA